MRKTTRFFADNLGGRGRSITRRHPARDETKRGAQHSTAPQQQQQKKKIIIIIMARIITAKTLVMTLALLGSLASVAFGSTRNLQQFSNGIQAPTNLYIPGLGLSVAIGNVPGYYTDTILGNLFAADEGALGFGDGALSDWGVASLTNQAVRNTINTVNDAAVNSQTIVAG